MSEPRRLKHGGGPVQRLLDSAAVDAPGDASRRRMAHLTSTAGGLARPAPRRERPAGAARTFVTWMGVAAAASLPLGLFASWWSSSQRTSGATELTAAAPVITAETPADVQAIAQARHALARRDAVAALAALDAYDRAHPSGPLRPEALGLRVRALREAGRSEEAGAVMRVLERDYPGHTLPAQGAPDSGQPQRP